MARKKIPPAAGEELKAEMLVLKQREKRLLERLERYEQDDEDREYPNGTSDLYELGDTGMVLVRSTVNRESAFSRVMKLQDAVYKVQGRISAVAAALRSAEEADQKMKLERDKLELAKLRATGAIEVPDE